MEYVSQETYERTIKALLKRIKELEDYTAELSNILAEVINK